MNDTTKCCEDHGISFDLPEELHTRLLAFISLGSHFLKEGDVKKLVEMVIVATDIAEHPEYDRVCVELDKRDHGAQLEVLHFLSMGGKVAREKLVAQLEKIKERRNAQA